MFTRGFRGFAQNALPLVATGLVTLVVYGAFRWPAQQLFNDDKVYQSIAVDLVGLILAGTIAYPWYSYALDSARGEKADLARPFANRRLFFAQFVSSFWFWAGVLLGVRYLAGLPSIFVILLYAFHGYVIADGKAKSGLVALGTSVRLGQGRRIALFALGTLLVIFNLFGAISLGFEVNPSLDPLMIGIAVVGLAVTTSVTLVCGAVLYDALYPLLGDDLIEAVPRSRRARNTRKSTKRGRKK